MQYRQGDVLLVKVSKLPVKLERKDNILAYGEVTGHKHRFPELKTVQVFKDAAQNQFVDLEESAELIHEEHDNIQIEKGRYKVIVQRENDLLGQVRQVVD